MNLRNLVAVGAAVVSFSIAHVGYAQEDLDDLLKALESETTEAAEEAAEEPAEEVAEEPAEEVDAVEEVEAVEEPAEEEAVTPEEAPEEEPTEEEVAEEEEPAAPETPAEPVAPEAPAEETVVAETAVAEDDDVLSLLNELSDEVTPEASATPAKPVIVQKPTYTGKDAALIAQLAETEKLRRRAYDLQAKREIEQARAFMRAEEYMDAAKHYRIAQKLLNDSPNSESLRKECSQGVAEGLYRAAFQEEAAGRRNRAIKLMRKALDLRHPKALRQLEIWSSETDVNAGVVDVSEIKHRQNDKEYKEVREKNLKHLKRARQLLGTKELDRALDECELVLISDPYNQDAIRLREKIMRKRQTILQQEREATRAGMIADVDKAWRPVYAVDAREIEKTTSQTLTTSLDKDPERAKEQMILKRMREIILPEVSFKPPATIYDAVQFFISASKDFDRPDLPVNERGFGFQMLSSAPVSMSQAEVQEESEGFGSGEVEEAAGATIQGAAYIPTISVNNISFYDALTLICESVGYKFNVRNGIIVVMPKGMSTEEMVTRSYPVVSAFMERMNEASSDLKDMQSQGFGGGFSRRNASNNSEEETNQEEEWKEFFRMLGVEWPEGSTIMYIKTIGKLRVKNTYENLAELEKALTEMNADPKLIEIEARFVEVSQEDLNSLGFEWILNSDYTLGLNKSLGRALGIRNGGFDLGSSGSVGTGGGTTGDAGASGGGQSSSGGVGSLFPEGTTSGSGNASGSTAGGYAHTQGASWIPASGSGRNVGVNSFGGANSTYQSGMRYLSTMSNHISGEGYSTNDQFLRVNAFLGSADLSMILHMLSQRSDTDLLSAPKILTKSDEEADIRVVTKYRYPTEYEVQTQSSTSSSGSNGGSQSAIIATVQPENFETEEVGVSLTVTPRLTQDGNLIDIDLNTRIVGEPTWRNYGMRIPFTGNTSLQNFEGIGDIFTGLSAIFTSLGEAGQKAMESLAPTIIDSASTTATTALDNITKSMNDEMTYYDVPMEQPFFHYRSVQSKVSVYPGATIVMGGLITETRKAMDDKIPFLGDLPFIGRFFRSHSEHTSKRNLLIFLTTRLVDVRGREVTLGGDGDATGTAEVLPAPVAPAAEAEND